MMDKGKIEVARVRLQDAFLHSVGIMLEQDKRITELEAQQAISREAFIAGMVERYKAHVMNLPNNMNVSIQQYCAMLIDGLPLPVAEAKPSLSRREANQAARKVFEAFYAYDFDFAWDSTKDGYSSSETQYAYQIFREGYAAHLTIAEKVEAPAARVEQSTIQRGGVLPTPDFITQKRMPTPIGAVVRVENRKGVAERRVQVVGQWDNFRLATEPRRKPVTDNPKTVWLIEMTFNQSQRYYSGNGFWVDVLKNAYIFLNEDGALQVCRDFNWPTKYVTEHTIDADGRVV